MTPRVLFGSFFVFLLIGMPVVFAMGLSTVVFLVLFGHGLPLTVIPHQMVAGVDNFPLLAIPFFFLAGELMNTTGITQRLVAFSAAIVGHVRGGLAYVVVVTNVIMAGFSGTALADASATSSVLIPAMKREGYHADFAAAITAAAAIGPIIPSSIPMIIVVGCLMDPLAGMLIFIPVILPLIKHLGITPVHFGLVVVLNLMIGLLTPPVGYLLYLSAAMADVSVDRVIREVWPLIFALLVVLAISTYWPGLVLLIPNMFQAIR